MGSLTLVWQPVFEKENFEFKSVKLLFKNWPCVSILIVQRVWYIYKFTSAKLFFICKYICILLALSVKGVLKISWLKWYLPKKKLTMNKTFFFKLTTWYSTHSSIELSSDVFRPAKIFILSVRTLDIVLRRPNQDNPCSYDDDDDDVFLGRKRKAITHLSKCDLSGSVGWGCKINWLYLCREVGFLQQESWIYDTKQSDDEASVMLELWGNAKLTFIAITPRSILDRKGSTW